MEEGRQVAWTMYQDHGPSVSAVVVAYTDGVELELRVGEETRRRLRFLRDTGATEYMRRIEAWLLRGGYTTDRRKPKRPPAVVGAPLARLLGVGGSDPD